MGGTRQATMPLGRNEHGAALPLALMGLLVLGAASAALLTVGGSEVQIAANHLRGTQAQYLAEAGLEDTFNVFRTNANLITTNVPTTLTSVPGLSGPGATLTASGNYTVQYRASGPNTVIVVSTGTSTTGGAQRTLRAVMSSAFTDAIRTGGSLTISGNPTVTGTRSCGNLHTNDILTISGNPSVTGSATASGTYSVSGNPTVGPGSGGGMPQEPIPVINPANFLGTAQATLPANQVFQMRSDGRILDGNNTLITTLSSGQSYNGWQYTSGTPAQWSLSDNTGYDGVYYLEGNVSISGNPGSQLVPWRTTILATGDLVVSGRPEITPLLTDTLFVAGLDIRMSGNPALGFNGLIAAHEQIDLGGNPTITGYIIAEDATSTSNTVTANSISGNPTITYNCNLNPPLLGPLQILSWGI